MFKWLRGNSNTAVAPVSKEKADNPLMIYISNSETSDLAACEQLWYYRHKLRLQTNKEPSRALAFGIYGHIWLEAYYLAVKGGYSIKDSMDAGNVPITELQLKGELDIKLALDIVTLMARYVNFYHEQDQSKYKILGVERQFNAPLGNDLGIAVKLDIIKFGISGLNAGQVVIEDHKFTDNFWKPEVLMMAGQLQKYIWTVNNDPAYQEKLSGMKVTKAYINQLRYRRMADHNEFFRRDLIPTTDVRQYNIMKGHRKLAAYAADLRAMTNEEASEHVVQRQDKSACEYCDFLNACNKKLDGLDESSELALGFRPSDYGNTYNNG